MADAWIICIQVCQNTMLQEEPHRVTGVICHTAGLHIAGQVAFDTNALLSG